MATPPLRAETTPPEPALSSDLEVAPTAQGVPDEARTFLLIALGALAVRLLAFPFTDNLYGDAVVRTELAERWLLAPKFITSATDGVLQFGPLHTYWLALFLKFWPNREMSGRLASMVVGMIGLWPTWRVALRQFGRTAAIWATLAYAAWGMHIQMSTTAGSESLALCLFALALDGLTEGIEEMRFGPLARSALFLNLACAVRYDIWMYIPLFTLAVLLGKGDRIAALTRSIMFGGLAALYPLLWMEGNERATGDALYAIHMIDAFHKRWTQDGVAWLGQPVMRAWGLVFWPGTLILTVSPLYGLLCLVGIGRAFKRKEKRLLAIFAAIPTAYFTFRAAVLLNFSPLARFAVAQLWLCLPYAYDGFLALTEKATPRRKKVLAALVAAVGVATPAVIAAMSYREDERWVDTSTKPTTEVTRRDVFKVKAYDLIRKWGGALKPVSPVSTMPHDQMIVAHWLRDHVQAPEALLLDYDGGTYTDIGVAFFSNIPEPRLVRVRWEEDPKEDIGTRVKRAHPTWAVLFKKGKLVGRPDAQREGDVLTAWGTRYRKVEGFFDDRYEIFHAE